MSSWSVFQYRDFRFYIASRFLVTLAWQSQAVAVAWLVYSLTNDPLSLGLVGLVEVVPAVGFALIAGPMVDRNERRSIVLLSQALIIGISILLWVLSLSGSELPKHIYLWLIYICVFLLGVGRAFLGTSQFAFFGQILDRKHYVLASTWVSTVWQVAASLGPAIGGFLYGQVGVSWTFLFCASLTLLAAISTSLIPPRARVAEEAREETFVDSLLVGAKFVYKTKVLYATLLLDLFAVLFGGAVALLPIFADYLNAGPEGLGMLRAAPFVGAFVMAFVLTHRPPQRNVGRLLLNSVASFGLCTICFAISKSFFWSFFLLALSGAFDAVSVVVRSSILQLRTPDHMRGRVAAVNSIFINCSNELGAFESGVAAKWMGVRESVIFGGIVTLIVVLITAWKSKELRTLSFESHEKRIE